MKKRKNNANKNDLFLPESLTSRTVTRSGIINDGKELVVSCGYAMSKEFGYFICWESQTPRQHNKVLYEYSDVVSFKKKTHDHTLRELLVEFKTYTESYENKQFVSN